MNQHVKSTKNLSMGEKWDLMVQNIVRPPRKIYSEEDLGSQIFLIHNQPYSRTQHFIPLAAKITKLTLYSPIQQNPQVPPCKKITILYLHSNASNKLQANILLEYLDDTIQLACFDFYGCGLDTMEDYVTLGIREAEQVHGVVKFLQGQNMGRKVVVWGRSMGAVTALIAGMGDLIVGDSPFLSFHHLCKQLSNKYSPCPLKICLPCIFPCLYSKLRKDIQSQASYNIDQLDSLTAVQRINPTKKLILIIGEEDEMISVEDVRTLYQVFPGKDKEMHVVRGGHNSAREPPFLRGVVEGIRRKFGIGKSKKIGGLKTEGMVKIEGVPMRSNVLKTEGTINWEFFQKQHSNSNDEKNGLQIEVPNNTRTKILPD